MDFSHLIASVGLALTSFFGVPAEPMMLGAQAAINAFQGGTGSSSPSGILYGDETIRLKTVTIGNNLTFVGGTLSATGGASSTLLSDHNLFSGNNTFSNTITGAISGNAGSATVLQTSRNINGVAFNGSASITINAASSTLLADNNTFTNTITGSITGNAGTATALAGNGTNASAGNAILGVDASGNAEGAFDVWTEAENTSAAYISDGNTNWDNSYGFTTFAYPFPSSATTSQVDFNGGLTTSELTASSGANLTGLVLDDITGSTQCLQVNSSGNVSGTGTTCVPFSYPFPSNATTTLITFSGGLSSASTTLTGPFVFANATGTNATTTNFFATLASSTSLYGANLSECSDAGDTLNWNGGAFSCGTDADTTYTAGDALTLTGNDIDFDGGATPSGDLGGTWASPSVTDDSHNHTSATISGLDISDDTDLTAGDGITLTDDDLDCDTASASVFGCLTAAHWTLFDNKVSSTSIDTSTELAAFISGETGSGALVFGTAPTISNATLSSTTLTGNFVFANATGTNATTTNLAVTGTASTSKFFADGLTSCTSNNVLTWTGGVFGCEADDQGAGGGWPFTPTGYGQSTTSILALLGGFMSTGSSTVQQIKIGNATTTNATTTNLSISGELDIDNLTSALVLTGSTGIAAEYAGTSCTNQFVRSLSALGAATCASINNDDWSGTDLSVSNGGTGASTLTGLLQGNGTSAITGITGTAGQFPYYNGSDTLLATSSIFLNTTGLLGVGASTTPWGIFSIEQDNRASPSFVVANQGSTTPAFIIGGVNANGNIGIGTSSPFATLSIGTGNGSSTKAVVVAEHQPATTTSITINAQNGNQQNVRLGTSATTITLSNIIDGQKLIVITCNPRSTAGAVTWASSPAGLIQWAGGTAPTQTTTANKCDVWSFLGTQGTSTLKYFGAQSAAF